MANDEAEPFLRLTHPVCCFCGRGPFGADVLVRQPVACWMLRIHENGSEPSTSSLLLGLGSRPYEWVVGPYMAILRMDKAGVCFGPYYSLGDGSMSFSLVGAIGSSTPGVSMHGRSHFKNLTGFSWSASSVVGVRGRVQAGRILPASL